MGRAFLLPEEVDVAVLCSSVERRRRSWPLHLPGDLAKMCPGDAVCIHGRLVP